MQIGSVPQRLCSFPIDPSLPEYGSEMNIAHLNNIEYTLSNVQQEVITHKEKCTEKEITPESQRCGDFDGRIQNDQNQDIEIHKIDQCLVNHGPNIDPPTSTVEKGGLKKLNHKIEKSPLNEGYFNQILPSRMRVPTDVFKNDMDQNELGRQNWSHQHSSLMVKTRPENLQVEGVYLPNKRGDTDVSHKRKILHGFKKKLVTNITDSSNEINIGPNKTKRSGKNSHLQSLLENKGTKPCPMNTRSFVPYPDNIGETESTDASKDFLLLETGRSSTVSKGIKASQKTDMLSDDTYQKVARPKERESWDSEYLSKLPNHMSSRYQKKLASDYLQERRMSKNLSGWDVESSQKSSRSKKKQISSLQNHHKNTWCLSQRKITNIQLSQELNITSRKGKDLRFRRIQTAPMEKIQRIFTSQDSSKGSLRGKRQMNVEVAQKLPYAQYFPQDSLSGKPPADADVSRNLTALLKKRKHLDFEDFQRASQLNFREIAASTDQSRDSLCATTKPDINFDKFEKIVNSDTSITGTTDSPLKTRGSKDAKSLHMAESTSRKTSLENRKNLNLHIPQGLANQATTRDTQMECVRVSFPKEIDDSEFDGSCIFSSFCKPEGNMYSQHGEHSFAAVPSIISDNKNTVKQDLETIAWHLQLTNFQYRSCAKILSSKKREVMSLLEPLPIFVWGEGTQENLRRIRKRMSRTTFRFLYFLTVFMKRQNCKLDDENLKHIMQSGYRWMWQILITVATSPIPSMHTNKFPIKTYNLENARIDTVVQNFLMYSNWNRRYQHFISFLIRNWIVSGEPDELPWLEKERKKLRNIPKSSTSYRGGKTPRYIQIHRYLNDQNIYERDKSKRGK